LTAVVGNTYAYRVRCSNATGDSGYSNESEVVVTGDKVAYFPDVAAGNYFDTPHVTVDDSFEIIWYGALDNFGTALTLLMEEWHDTVDNNKRFRLIFQATGALRLFVRDPSGQDNYETAVMPLSPHQKFGVRVNWTIGTGAVQFDIDYTGDHKNPVWTPFESGTHSKTSLATGGVRELTVSGNASEANAAKGETYYASLSVGGVLQAEFEPDQSPSFGTGASWTSTNTGEVWTGQGNARISAVNTLVWDTFTDANGTDLTAHTPDVDLNGAGWISSTGGGFGINSNQCERTAGAGTYLSQIDTGATDQIVSAVVNNATNADLSMGVMTRADATGNYYLGYSQGDSLYLYEQSSNGFNGRGGMVHTANPSGEQLYIRSEGAEITTWVGADSLNWTATENLSNTHAGIMAYADATFDGVDEYDNFKVTNITDTPT
jgi:hypothetical protein